MRGFFAVARRPRWIGGLLLALAIAGGFAALGQWQLERSFANVDPDPGPDTEQAVPLTSIVEPQTGVTDSQLGRRVTVSGSLTAGDLSVLSDRDNGSASGYWLVGRLITDDGVSLAVALGWSEDRAGIDAVAADGPQLTDERITGRYLPSEGPQQTDFEAGQRSAMAVPQLLNEWDDPAPGPAYSGYLVLAEPIPGLEPIISPEPIREVGLNLLNVFYAVEWALFGGFAVYLWYRVVRDVVEREREEALETALAGSDKAGTSAPRP